MQAQIAPLRLGWTTLALSACSAGLGWSALVVDFTRHAARCAALGMGIAETCFSYLRYFTIEANLGTALLMTAAAVAVLHGRPQPPAPLFRAALVYMVVTGATYELLLRRLWSPQGMQFLTDLVFHDAQPVLTMLFWLVCAPKRPLPWRGLPWLLVYPALYFALTELAGALGAGYSYGFLDAARLGTSGVLTVAAAFLAAFLALGLVATGVAHLITGDRSAAASPRS